MANPQIENGYLKVANEIWDNLNKIHLSDGERRCLGVVIRKTYGWGKLKDNISLSKFQELTILSRQRVCISLKKLVTKKILGSQRNGTTNITTYWFIKDYEKWLLTNQRKDTSNQKDTSTSHLFDTKLVNEKTHTKEINKYIKKGTSLKTVFKPPTLEEVRSYCKERDNSINPTTFIDHYETTEWMRGKNKIKNWRACIRTWENKDQKGAKYDLPPLKPLG